MKGLSVGELNALPKGTIVRDMDDGELGKIHPCVFGGPRNKIKWDNGCVSVILGKSGAGFGVALASPMQGKPEKE